MQAINVAGSIPIALNSLALLQPQISGPTAKGGGSVFASPVFAVRSAGGQARVIEQPVPAAATIRP
jgi:hypothetical protein